jgi:hypothetical protein
MTRTIELLTEKNLYFERFIGLNRDQMEKLNLGDFADLENFREQRESILNIIKRLDSLIEPQTHGIDFDTVSEALRTQIKTLLDRKEMLVKVILGQDLDIMQLIEQAKSNIIRDLQATTKSRKVVGAFKSGTGIRETDLVDEEA